MRGLSMIAIAALAACEEGVVLEVHVPPGSQATSVRLFVGFEPCVDARGVPCPGLAPPSLMANVPRDMLPGVVYHREPLDDASVREAKVDGGVARFRIETASGHSTLPFAVAIDNLAASAQYIPELSLDGARRYRIDLAPAMAGALGKSTSSVNVVEIWNQPTKMLPCMGFERWKEGAIEHRVFVVPADDPDCDELVVNECAPLAHKGSMPPTIEQTTCINHFGELSICRPGGLSCNDNPGAPSLPCQPSEYCLPSLYCEQTSVCSARFQLAEVVKCLFETPPPTNARLACTIGVQPSSDGSRGIPCTPAIPFDAMPAGPGAACVKPTTNKLLLPDQYGAQAPMPLAFVESATYTSRDGGESRALKVTLRHEFDCKHKLELEGEVARDAIDFDERSLFAQIWVSRNGGPVRKLLVPVEVVPVTGCTNTTRCTLVVDPNDSLGKCTR